MSVSRKNRSLNVHHHSVGVGTGGDDTVAIQWALDLVETSGGGIVQLGQQPRYRASQLEVGHRTRLHLGDSQLEWSGEGLEVVRAKSYTASIVLIAGSQTATITPEVPVGTVVGVPDPVSGQMWITHVTQSALGSVLLADTPTFSASADIDFGAVRAGVLCGDILCDGAQQGARWEGAGLGRLEQLDIHDAGNVGLTLNHGAHGNAVDDVNVINPVRHGITLFRGATRNKVSRFYASADRFGGHGVMIDDRTSAPNAWDAESQWNELDGVTVRQHNDEVGSSAVHFNGSFNTAANVRSDGLRVACLFSYGVAAQAPQRPSRHNTASSVVFRGGIGGGNAVQFQDGTENCAVTGVSVADSERAILVQGGVGNTATGVTASGTPVAFEVMAPAVDTVLAGVSTGGGTQIDNGTNTQLAAVT